MAISFKEFSEGKPVEKTGIDMSMASLEQPKPNYLQRLDDKFSNLLPQIGENIQEAKKELEKPSQIPGFDYDKARNVLWKGGVRTAADVFGTAISPVTELIGGAVEDTLGSASKMFPKTMSTLEEYLINIPSNYLSDIPAVQDFAMRHPNAEKDLARLVDLVFATQLSKPKIPSSVFDAQGTKVYDGVTRRPTTPSGTLTLPSPIGGASKGTAGAAAASGIMDTIATKFKGATQVGKDIVGRVQRTGGRVSEFLTKSAEKADRIAESLPAISDAIKVDLDDALINTILKADEPTLSAIKEVIEIASEQGDIIGPKKQPSIVSGELATEQYELFLQHGKDVGEAIGEAVNALSGGQPIDMSNAVLKLNESLGKAGVTINDKGILDFSASDFTPAERIKIAELYNLTLEGGTKLTPEQIQRKDRMFSKLQREARFEKIGDIVLRDIEMPRSVFQVFRDAFSDELSKLSPELKQLNREYAQFKRFNDDLESTLFKTPNLNITQTDLDNFAEFAKVNLRRIYGEAVSSPAFELVADELDKISRNLGYKGATPKDIALIANELRKLYPETIPKTGFVGGIRMGVFDIIEKATQAGAPNLQDKQSALKNLVDSLIKKFSGPDMKGGAINPKAMIEDIAKAISGDKEAIGQIAEAISKDGEAIDQIADAVSKDSPAMGQIAKQGDITDDLIAEAKKYKSAEEFIKAQGTPVYHGGTEIKEVGNMRSKWGAFYMTDNPTYAKSYGGNKSVLNKMVITKKAKLADLIKPSDDLIKQIDEIISPKATGETIKIKKPDGSFVEVPKTKGGLSNPVHSSADIIQGIKDGKAYYAEMPEVKEALKKLGYDGQITSEVPYAKNIGVWNKKVIKTKSQLTDIWNKANKTNADDALINEAKKYKSAEEFVKAQPVVYHGGEISKLENKPLFTAVDDYIAKSYDPYGKLNEFYPIKNLKELDITTDYSKVKEAIKSKFDNYGENYVENTWFDPFSSSKKKVQEKYDKYISKYKNFDAIEKRYNTLKDESVVSKYGELWEEDVQKAISYIRELPEAQKEKVFEFDILDRVIKEVKDPSRDDVYANWKQIFKYAKDNGYDSIKHITQSKDAQQIGIERIFIDPTKSIKTKSQLTDIWNKANDILM